MTERRAKTRVKTSRASCVWVGGRMVDCFAGRRDRILCAEIENEFMS